jgi:hypothetical protein
MPPSAGQIDFRLRRAATNYKFVSEYSSLKIQEFPSLSAKAKARWQGERPHPGQMEPDCPGIAVGHFKTDQLSFAVLLVPIDKPDAAYRLVIFTLSGDTAPGSLETADQWDNGGAANTSFATCRLRRSSVRNG